jgi:hypothetical protein
MGGLEQVVSALEAEDIKGVLWINGSFLTNKIDCGDVDMSLQLEWSFATLVEDSEKAVVLWVDSNLRASHHCDSFVFIVYPKAHPRYPVGEEAEKYWRDRWSYPDGSKGIAALRLGASNG